MKASILGFGSLATLVSGHAIFQELTVDGVSQGPLTGIRAPDSNSPIQDVNAAGMGCNVGIVHKDSTIVTIPAGAEVGAWWGHVIGGPQGSEDPDHPIAISHKGPIMVYLAAVDDAASADPAGLEWFKVAEAGLENGQWAVDAMIEADGWHTFTLPSCVAPGQYLMRVELIALHSASLEGEAQFYMECAQIEVTGSGTSLGDDFVSFPGAYSAQDPGILISIYDNSGNPNNNGQPYEIPGPSVLAC